MTKQQARELLVKATALLKLSREEHQAVSQALQELKPEEEKKEKKK